MVVFYLALGFMGIYFVLMSVRMIFLKDGQFKGTCASQSPFLKQEGATCGFCGKDVGSCEDDEEEETNEVNKVLGKF
jgi:hypothetical protein